MEYFQTLGHRFLAAGDVNAKNIYWGSRITTTKGRNLLAAIENNNAKYLSTGEPTYWPTDPNKVPDLIDFCVIKNLRADNFKLTSRFELSSDHSPIQIDYFKQISKTPNTTKLCNHKTCWETYREFIDHNLVMNVSLKTADEIDSAILFFNEITIQAAEMSTPTLANATNKLSLPTNIQNKIKEKRKLRKKWQTTRLPADKEKLNKATRELKDLLKTHENTKLNQYLQNLTPTSDTNYSLWKATKNIANRMLCMLA